MILPDDIVSEEGTSQPRVSQYSFLIAVALAASNVALYLHSRSLEATFRQSSPEGRPWLWPEDATGFFAMVWLLILAVSIFAAFRMRKTSFNFQAISVSILALVALLANGFCLSMEAFDF